MTRLGTGQRPFVLKDRADTVGMPWHCYCIRCIPMLSRHQTWKHAYMTALLHAAWDHNHRAWADLGVTSIACHWDEEPCS